MALMEQTTARTIDDVNRDYTQVCAEIGDVSLKLDLLKGRLAGLLLKANALNNEGDAIHRATEVAP